MLQNIDPLLILIRAFVLLTALPIHECAHGYVAYLLGDPTAKNQGRLTLNPIKHLDPIGSLMILFVGFGYAKPVPVNPFYFKNRKLGMALTAFAGPLSNMLIAYITLTIYKFLFYLFPSVVLGDSFWKMMFLYIVLINITLGVFNLLPLPPLDGSKILNIILPERLYFQVMKYERFMMLGLLLLLFTGFLDKPIEILSEGLFGTLDYLSGFVDIIGRTVR